jgi:CPA1 family monovalent cation:H+ antiporter
VSRLQIGSVWELVVFILNATIFLILGAQFAGLIRDVSADEIAGVVYTGLLIGITVIVVRLAWVPIGTWLPRALSSELRRRDPMPSWKSVFLISWTSMRGIVSLAAALALPAAIGDGNMRSKMILITMCVIVMTLLVQGLTLKSIIRAFKFTPEKTHVEEERLARRAALRRGAEALEDQAREPGVNKRDVEWLRNEIRDRVRLHEQRGAELDGRRRLRMGMIAAERRVLVRLRNEGAISDEVLRQLEQELDLEAIRNGAGEERN